MTTAELAARIKAKYPDYAQMDDADLVSRVIAKHPEYKAQLDEPVAPAAPARFDPSAVAAGPGAIPSTVEVTPEQVATVGTIAAAPFLGAAAAGSGAVGTAARLAASPLGIGSLRGAYDLYRGKSPAEAAVSGAEMGLLAKAGGNVGADKVLGGGLLGRIAKLIMGRRQGLSPQQMSLF